MISYHINHAGGTASRRGALPAARQCERRAAEASRSGRREGGYTETRQRCMTVKARCMSIVISHMFMYSGPLRSMRNVWQGSVVCGLWFVICGFLGCNIDTCLGTKCESRFSWIFSMVLNMNHCEMCLLLFRRAKVRYPLVR